MTDSTPPSAHDRASGRYVVIARRYRPQTFDELVGQEHVARSLQQAITSDRVGHAYLFTGARGVGKTSAARIFAKALNCVRGPTPTPCNECDVCLSVSTGDDVDVLEIDGASNRGIDEIRQLRQNVAVRPSRVRYKIYIIDEVHMLTKEAFNALLKTLEEPPEHVKFIFATTEPHKIPITILSRCQRFDFAGISPPAIEQRLAQIAAAEGVAVEAEALQILASRAAGSMRDSQSLLEQLLAVGHQRITAADVTHLLGIAPAERLSGLVGHLVARNAAAALAELDAIVRNGVEVGLLLDQLVGYFRDVMAVIVGCSPQQMLYALPSQAQQVAEVGNKLGLSTILAIGQILDHSASRMRLTMHGRTLVEMAIVRICQLDELDDIAALVAELRGAGQERAALGNSGVASKNETYGRPSGGIGRPAPNAASAAPNSAMRASNSERSTGNPSLAEARAPNADVESTKSDSVIAQWRRALTEQKESPQSSPPRESLRDKKAKVAEQPFVRQAMELFDVPSGQFRYTPPEADGNSKSI
ncbi:MAG TPA: DNA polymerase III subunit gamma/tau [Lacipirellulaceae bacterium]